MELKHVLLAYYRAMNSTRWYLSEPLSRHTFMSWPTTLWLQRPSFIRGSHSIVDLEHALLPYYRVIDSMRLMLDWVIVEAHVHEWPRTLIHETNPLWKWNHMFGHHYLLLEPQSLPSKDARSSEDLHHLRNNNLQNRQYVMLLSCVG